MDTASSPLALIRALGYSEREARFLALAATHGGYFLGRQFLAALGTTKGRLLVDFTARLRSRRHATAQTFCRKTRVYHLTSAVFDAAQIPVGSHRRRRPVLALKRRLMALDFALARPDIELLHTREAVRSVCARLGIAPTLWPAVEAAAQAPDVVRPALTAPRSRGTRGPVLSLPTAAPTPRRALPAASQTSLKTPEQGSSETAAIDHQELFGLQMREYGAPRLLAIYIDDGARSLAGFRSFLRTQWPLLATIPNVAVAYVGETRERAEAAATCVRPTLRECQRASLDSTRATVYEYFDLRQKVKAEQWNLFTTALMERYMDLRQQFGDALDEDYARWLRGGEVALLAEANPAAPPDIELVPIVLPFSYLALASTRRRSP